MTVFQGQSLCQTWRKRTCCRHWIGCLRTVKTTLYSLLLYFPVDSVRVYQIHCTYTHAYTYTYILFVEKQYNKTVLKAVKELDNTARKSVLTAAQNRAMTVGLQMTLRCADLIEGTDNWSEKLIRIMSKMKQFWAVVVIVLNETWSQLKPHPSLTYRNMQSAAKNTTLPQQFKNNNNNISIFYSYC